MSTRIRLRRLGANKRPFYRVVVADQRAPRDGRFIENIGKYHPLEDPSLIEIDQERALHWLRTGAQPSAQVRNLMVKTGIWDVFVAERPSAAGQVRVRTEPADTPKLSKKAAAKAKAAAEAPPAPEVVQEPAAPVAEEAAPEVVEESVAEPVDAPEPETVEAAASEVVEEAAVAAEASEPEASAEAEPEA
ncbi:MAG: 30S ribosomal protein S16 [Actinomycetota bacterium]